MPNPTEYAIPMGGFDPSVKLGVPRQEAPIVPINTALNQVLQDRDSKTNRLAVGLGLGAATIGLVLAAIFAPPLTWAAIVGAKIFSSIGVSALGIATAAFFGVKEIWNRISAPKV